MNRPTQAQLDDFGHRLASLTKEFQELRRQADAWNVVPAEPTTQAEAAPGTYEVPEWLHSLDELIRAGRAKEAVRRAGRPPDELVSTISRASRPNSTGL